MGISNRPAVDTSQPPITADDVIEELQNLLPNTSIRPDSDLFSVGFDSLRIMRFAGLAEKPALTFLSRISWKSQNPQPGLSC